MKKLRVLLEIGEDVLLLSSRIKKKSDPGKFHKSTVDNKSIFDKNAFFTITNRQTLTIKRFTGYRTKRLTKTSCFASYEKKFTR